MDRLRPARGRAFLQEGWVIANHILVSFHVAFISSVLALPAEEIFRTEVLKFIFVSPETAISALFVYVSFHTGIALHEMGHWLTAAKLSALNKESQAAAEEIMGSPLPVRIFRLARIFALAPYGRAVGIKREALNYYPDAPYNLAVAAAGPRMSMRVATIALPPAVAFLTVGLLLGTWGPIYAGRLLLSIGLVSLLDFLLADPGKFRDFRRREQRAAEKAKTVARVGAWWDQAAVAHQKILTSRMQEITHPQLGPVTAPWQFRNCGMGGRHTESEYPESNISMQEAMFLILGASDYQEAQEMTVRLQNRLKEVIEKSEGCRVMGIGLEGGIAPYIEKGTYPLPEVRLWAMMRRTIEECGYRPGIDVAIALDPAMTELETAYRKHHRVPDAVGMYLFWRDKALTVMDRDGVLEIYKRAINEYDIPILSIEDGYSENDFEGWRNLLTELGDRVLVIGDDLVTTNDATIELAAEKGLINTALIKANQIGSLSETILAMLVALGKGMELVVSHRSKSPNDDMEAQIALAVNSLGLKAGGGANTERLMKYQAVTEFMHRGVDAERHGLRADQHPVVRRMFAYEEPTNAGVPTVGVTVEFGIPDAGVALKFRGATPLGTSAGTGEAIHLVDTAIEAAEYREVVSRNTAFFRETEPGVVAFNMEVSEADVRARADEELTALWNRAQRYDGKGCLNAADNVLTVIAPAFAGRIVSALGLRDVDRILYSLELHVALRRGKLRADASSEERIRVIQRKQNLGMNAMLSVSLAMARGIAHLRGKELFELLREEMFAIIERLAEERTVAITGSRFEDYVRALRDIAADVEAEGRSLYSVLRESTGIYQEAGAIGPSAARLGLDETIPEAARDLLRAVAPKLGEDFWRNAHHGLGHARDLLGRANMLADRLGQRDRIDWRVLAAAVCFHDLGADRRDHGAEGAALAREVLVAVDGLPQDDIARVETAILLHQDRSRAGAEARAGAGIEAQILYDVDQLDAFGMKGAYRYIAIWSARGTPLSGILADAQARYQSLTFDETRRLAGDDYAFTESFFGRLAEDGSSSDLLAGAAGVAEWIRTHYDVEPVAIADGALAAVAEATPGPDVQYVVDFFTNLRSIYAESVEEEARVIPAPTARPAAAKPQAVSTRPAPVSVAAERGAAAVETVPLLTEDEESRIAEVNRQLFRAFYSESDPVTRREALWQYVALKAPIAGRSGRFGIVNNRIFRADGRLLIPYLVGDMLVVHSVEGANTETTFTQAVPAGTILTDGLLERMAGVTGELCDLEIELFAFPPDKAPAVRVSRIRDMAGLLGTINDGANRNEAIYLLRVLVARLSLFSFKEYLSAKNLQSEVQNLTAQQIRFLNSPLSDRVPFLARALVRNISGVISKPKVIDRLWNDTIDLAEIHVRGSDIANELRRSTHHAIGRHTMRLAQAYMRYLETGEQTDLVQLGLLAVGPADEEARRLDRPREIVGRVIADLEQLLGTSETVTRIREWQNDFATTLVRCQFGRTLADETEAALAGMREGNRWTYFHHLRIIKGRVSEFSPALSSAAATLEEIAALLEEKPDQDSFVAETVQARLRSAVDGFVAATEAAYKKDLFARLEIFLASYERREFYDTFVSICNLRRDLRCMLNQHAFPEHRLLLFQLDCLLEEMGYLAMRHVASEHDECGTDFQQCLDIIHGCIFNLPHDGLYSRQLLDLAGLLQDRSRTYAETRNILEQVQRDYHHIVQRVITPFESMRARLDLDEEDLRIALANIQRYLHDLNSVAYFTDLARAFIIQLGNQTDVPVDPEAKPRPAEPWSIVHLSHRDEIAKVVAAGESEVLLRDRYGGKGSGLIYISNLGIPTRDAFILPTSLAGSGASTREPERLEQTVLDHLRILEDDVSRRDKAPKSFADPRNPLLLAVRGGSVFSMPGMLQTVLFVGINDAIAEGMARIDPWCAYDCYRRFLATYADAVWGLDVEQYGLVDETKKRYGVRYKYDLPWEGMKEVAQATRSVLRQAGHGDELEELLAKPEQQLLSAVRAVQASWNADSARRYREVKHLCESWNTAVIVQEMALGNRKGVEIREGMDETKVSLTGVIPRTMTTKTGVRACAGDFKFAAVGYDLVGGLTKSTSFRSIDELGTFAPMLNRRLGHVVATLLRFMGTDQEVEFTVENGVLSILQSRTAEIGVNKRLATFADPGAEAGHGIGVRGGGFRGVAVFDEQDLRAARAQGIARRDDVDGILVILENPTPEHIPLVLEADGLLAAKGGSTSHAAIAVNGIGDRDYTAVLGVEGLQVRARRHEAQIVGVEGQVLHTIRAGDIVSIDGGTGDMYLGTRTLREHKGT